MTELFANPIGRNSVAFLFHPSAVPVIDVFRSIGSLDDQFDLALLDGPERGLAPYAQPGAAKGVVSDALLLAFAMTRQRGRPFDHRPLGSRCGTLDEYCLLTLIGASRQPGSEVAREASALLGIAPQELLSSLVGELARHIDLGIIVFPLPNLSEFRAAAGIESRQAEAIVEAANKPGRHFGL